MRPETVLVRNAGLSAAPIDRELVMLNPASDHYIALDEIGRAVWELLENPLPVDELCRRLSQRFDATPERIATDLLPFLSELSAEGIISVVDNRIS